MNFQEKIEIYKDIIVSLDYCVNDYLYILDVENDEYFISPHAAVRFKMDNAYFKNPVKEFKKFVSTKKNTVLCVWGTGDLKELFRNITYYDLPYKTLTKSYINIQHYASRYFNNPAGKSIGLQNAIQILNLDQDKSYHNALNDAYYTAQVFIRIYNPSIVPDVYMYTTVKPSSAKKNIKKQINYDKLFAEFAKILQRDLTKEDKKIIDLAYKMGKTNQFLTESTIYKKR